MLVRDKSLSHCLRHALFHTRLRYPPLSRRHLCGDDNSRFALGALTGGNQFPPCAPHLSRRHLCGDAYSRFALSALTGGNQFPPCAPHGLRRGLVSSSYCPVSLNVTLWRSPNLNHFSHFESSLYFFLHPNPPRPACPAFFSPLPA